MNSPLVWIIIPFLISVVLFGIRKKRIYYYWIPVFLCLLLIILAIFVPIDKQISVLGINFEIKSSLTFLGRVLQLSDNDRPIIILFYIIGLIWFIGSETASTEKKFISLGTATISLFIAAFAVRPFLYAAIIIELAILISIIMIVSKENEIKRGVLRYLVFQSISMPFILLAGWAATGVEANPTDNRLFLEAIIFMALGFAFLLAIFPLYIWLPQLTEEASTYTLGFIFSFLPSVGLLLLLKFINSFTWLREYYLLYDALRIIGILMIITSGIWVVFENKLTRIFGYSIVFENGFSLLALSIGDAAGYKIFACMFVSRFISIALMSLSLTILSKRIKPDYNSVQGVMFNYPMASIMFLTSLLNVGGFPLFAGFPAKFLFYSTIPKNELSFIPVILIGSLCYLIFGVRIFISFINTKNKVWQIKESWQENLLIVVGLVFSILVGIIPAVFFDQIIKILSSFEVIF